ncbi:MAG TPA: tripartite tricarboxylate transporter substrate binding protein [Burkholderiales bacterium]|nr:tripartite tricarboxylate transporter substrate binding protein [Burkholderiales bacterium]
MRALLALLLAISLQAHAQYPARAVRVVVPFPAGGPTDVLARVVAQKLGSHWSQPVVVENKPGAGGSIGADFVAKSAPDGYTLVMATSSTHSIGPVLQKLPYDAQKDFAPVVHAWSAPNALIVSPVLGVSDVRGLVALAKSKPGQLNYASSGNGTIPHLSGELFKLLAGIDVQHVPYKGTGLSIPDIARGQVAFIFDSIITAQQHARSGSVKLIAVSTARRSALLPEVPTMIEAGVPGYESTTWFGLLAPAGTPRELISKVNGDVGALLKESDVRERFAAAGAEPIGGSPEAFAETIQAERAKWAKVVQAARIKVD